MEYIVHLLILIGMYAILGLSLNFIVGYTGLLSVTHAAFFGVGAYATALLLTVLGLSFWPAMLIGAILAGLLGAVIGTILARFRGDIYALASFGFSTIVYSIFLNWQEVTRGPLGIPGIPRPEIFGFVLSENTAFLILVLVLLGITYYVFDFLTGTTFGKVIQGIREDEGMLQVFGYKTEWYKFLVFVLGAFFAGIAGSLFATYISFIDPSSFVLMESIFILSLIILGGLGSHKGAVLGAVVLILLPEVLRFVGFPSDIAAQMRQFVYGLMLILFMMYRPQGILGEYKM